MIIGSGLLARTFSQYADSDKVLIFASGVSNSSSTDISAFEREVNLVRSHIGTKMKFIYFSTVSIYDPTLSDSQYIKHKEQIEEIISQNCASYIIFRLPILLGETNNLSTLCNYVYNAIMNGHEIAVFEKACRYIIDTEDLKKLLPNVIDNPDLNRVALDVNFDNAIKISELISFFEVSTGHQAKTKIVQKGGCYATNNQWFLAYLEEIGVVIPTDYVLNCIINYYGSRKLNA